MATQKNDSADVFSDVEKQAMKDLAAERKAAKKGKVDGETDVQEKIAAMAQPDRATAERLHVLIKAAGPMLEPRTWYGMPAYSLNGKVVLFFQSGQKFGTRYCTLGFSDSAKLDDGDLWPNSYALQTLTPEAEARVTALVKKAIGEG